MENPLATEIPPYSNVNLVLRFEGHQIDNPNLNKVIDKTSQLVEMMHNVFRKDQQNFLFFESAYEKKDHRDQILEGYKKFGSMILGLFYSSISEEQRQIATREQLDELYQRELPALALDPNDADLIARFTAMDELISEGFIITPIFEDSSDLNREEEEVRQLSAIARGEDYYAVKKDDPRNKKVVDQIIEIAESASNNSDQTNILVIMGTAHSGGIMELLPLALRNRSQAISEYSEVTAAVRRATMEIFSKYLH